MRKIKVFTQLDRINWFSDIWLKFHTRIFDKSNFLFIYEERFLDNLTLKEYLLRFGFQPEEINIINIGNIPLNYEQRFEFSTPFINKIQSDLLDQNDVVIYLDIDELLYHPCLIEILNSFNSDYLVTNSIDVTHNLAEEGDFDFTKTISSQRNFMNSSLTARWYTKPIITRKPIEWINGRHGTNCNLNPTPSMPELYLIHLGKIDFNFCNILNNQNIQMREWTQSQNAMIGQDLETYFRHFSFETIPDNIKKILNF